MSVELEGQQSLDLTNNTQETKSKVATTETELKAAKPTKAKPGALRDIAKARGEMYFLKPSQINIEEGFNVRDFTAKDTKEHLKTIKASIKEQGITNPGIIRMVDGKIVLVSGHTRHQAALELEQEGDKDIVFPVILEAKGTSEVDRQANLHVNNMSKNFAVLELSELAVRLAKIGNLNASQVAKKLHVSPAYVGSLNLLYTAPEKLKKMVRDGDVAATMAIDMIREHGGDKALALLSDAQAEASANGKGKVTRKSLPKKKGAAERAGTPLYYQRSTVNDLITTLCEIAVDSKLGKPTQGVRGLAKKALEDADVDAKEWLADAVAEEEEE